PRSGSHGDAGADHQPAAPRIAAVSERQRAGAGCSNGTRARDNATESQSPRRRVERQGAGAHRCDAGVSGRLAQAECAGADLVNSAPSAYFAQYAVILRVLVVIADIERNGPSSGVLQHQARRTAQSTDSEWREPDRELHAI